MADEYDFIGIKSVRQFERIGNKKVDAVLAMANHVKRGLQGELGAKPHITENKTSLNYCLHGLEEPKAIQNYVNGQIALAGIKPQANHVILISVVYSLPVEWHSKDTRPYFHDCYEWTKRAFACELVSFDVHLDESAPHAHALVLPIIHDEKTGNKKLGGSYIKGDRSKITGYRRNFFTDVASKYGFKKRSERSSAKDKALLADALLNHFKNTNDPIFKTSCFKTVRDFIYQQPEKFAQDIGFELNSFTNQAKAKNFVDHKRSKGKGRFIK